METAALIVFIKINQQMLIPLVGLPAKGAKY